MWVIPSFLGSRKSNVFDPFSIDTWDPSDGILTSGLANVTSKAGILQLSGERNKEQEKNDNDRWHRIERSSGKFLRRFRLPENTKTDEFKAKMTIMSNKICVYKLAVTYLRLICNLNCYYLDAYCKNNIRILSTIPNLDAKLTLVNKEENRAGKEK